MVQAARSGVQNIAEGSQASANVEENGAKIDAVARASLEELKWIMRIFCVKGAGRVGRENPCANR